jgi:hypothetical protein
LGFWVRMLKIKPKRIRKNHQLISASISR